MTPDVGSFAGCENAGFGAGVGDGFDATAGVGAAIGAGVSMIGALWLLVVPAGEFTGVAVG